MIRLHYATTLALTKLRTRKVRLTITVVISGLLFSGLIAASLITQGAFRSIDSFTKEGFGNRYVVFGSTNFTPEIFTEPTIIDNALAINKATIAEKKVEAKRLGLQYDPASEPQPVQEYKGPQGETQRTIDYMHPAARQSIALYTKDHPKTGRKDMQAAANGYNAKHFYESRNYDSFNANAQVVVLENGKEDFEPKVGKESYSMPTGLSSLLTSWTTMSDDLLKPFILPNETLAVGTDGSVPMVIPYSAAEELLQLKKQSGSVSSSDKLARTKQVRKDIKGHTFQICYRSTSSASLITQAISTQQEIEKNKNKKDYKKPDLIYGLPTEACGPSPIIRDVRTKEQKKIDANQRIFDEKFGASPIEQQIITFRVVGVTPDLDMGNATRVSQIISSIVQSSLGAGWYTPMSQTTAHPILSRLFEEKGFSFMTPRYFAEFNNADDERAFIDKKSCTENPNDCKDSGTPFNLTAFGSNSLALESGKKNFNKFFGLAAIGIVFIAAIIMMGTVGRMIADSRRETAVFRAIGAKRLDLAKVYIIYTLFLSAIICIFAFTVGMVMARYANYRLSDAITVQALVAYNAQDLQKTFSLFALQWSDLLKILGCIVTAGLLSSVLPLLRNLRRNPIRDMRDDT